MTEESRCTSPPTPGPALTRALARLPACLRWALAAVATSSLLAQIGSGGQSALAAAGAGGYSSLPGLRPPQLRVSVNRAGQASGLIFVAPIPSSTQPMTGEAGPLILEGDGNPIWFHPVPSGEEALDFTTQSYQGHTVLSWWQGKLADGAGTATPTAAAASPAGFPQPGARFLLFNQHYQPIRTIIASEGWTADPQELVTTPHDSALFIADRLVPMDLARYGGPADGEVWDMEVQEVSLETGTVLFSWDLLEHVSLAESQTKPPADEPWDPYQVDSLQELPNGHVLVSVRNTSSVYVVEKVTGRIAWQLGGARSTFKLMPSARFYWQQDVQLRHGDEVSMLDNGCCGLLPAGIGPAEQESHGLLLRLNDIDGTATVLHRYSHAPALYTSDHGSMQTFRNGNALIGWGTLPYLSEYSADGALLYAASLPAGDASERALRLGWRGTPPGRPQLAARRDGPRTTLYVSWNGASEVKSWKIFTGASAARVKTNPGPIVAVAQRSGLQTAIPLSTDGQFFMAEAFAADGALLGISKPARVEQSPRKGKRPTGTSGATR